MRSVRLALVAALLAGGCDPTTSEVLTSAPEAGSPGPCLIPDGAAEAGDDANASTDAPTRGPHGGTWPTFGHDAQRTSHAEGAGEMHQPAIAWSRRMGGVLAAAQAQVGDIDSDSRPEVVSIAGGRVTATKPDGSTLWQGPLAGARRVLGVWNLDGAAGVEIVVDSSSGVQVLDGATGQLVTSLLTQLPATATFVPERASGGILVVGAGSRTLLAGYDFRSGTHVTTPAWSKKPDNETDTFAGDVDGDGTIDLVHPLDAGFEVLDPITGAVKYAAPAIGPAAYGYLVQLANVDGAPGLEIVAVDTSYLYSPATGIYVLGVRNGSLVTLWSSAQTPALALGADYYTTEGSVADLDGNGSVEVVWSQWDGSAQKWTTRIADAAKGTALQSIDGSIVEAVADVDGDGMIDIAARSGPLADRRPPRSDLRVYDFVSPDLPPQPKAWKLARAHVMQRSIATRTHPGEPPVPMVGDFDPAPGDEMLVGVDDAQKNAETAIAVLRGDGTIASTATVAPGITPSALWTGDGLTAAGSDADVLALGDDGVAHVRTSSLEERATFATGSYANWLAVYGLDVQRAMIAMAMSNRDLLWLDGTRLHADGTPYRLAHVPGVVDTSVLASSGWAMDPLTYLAGASPTFVAYVQGETGVTMVGMDSAGVESWRTPLATGSSVSAPATTQDLTGDGKQDLVVPLVNVNQLQAFAVFDGVTGGIVRSTPLQTIHTGGDQSTTGSLVDVDGDGVPDLVVALHDVGVVAIDLSADPMHELWNVPGLPNGTVSAAAVDTQGTSLLRSNGNWGWGPYARISLRGAVVVARDQGLSQGDSAESNAAALVRRSPGASEFDMVAAGTAPPALSRVRRVAGDTLDTAWTIYVANGSVSPQPPATPFALHGPIALDVDGDGADEVVLGGDDGWLYALRASDGSIAFAVDLGAPVVHVLAADVDLDPATEILASLGDGRLVAIDETGRYVAIRDAAGGDGSAGGDDGAGNDGGCVGGDGVVDAPHRASCTCSAGASGMSGDAAGAIALCVAGVALGLRKKRGRRRACRSLACAPCCRNSTPIERIGGLPRHVRGPGAPARRGSRTAGGPLAAIARVEPPARIRDVDSNPFARSGQESRRSGARTACPGGAPRTRTRGARTRARTLPYARENVRRNPSRLDRIPADTRRRRGPRELRRPVAHRGEQAGRRRVRGVKTPRLPRLAK